MHDVGSGGTDEYIRRLSGEAGDGDVILTGVVHGHPASERRVQSVVDAAAPAVLAVELPPLAVPLFERYAGMERPPPGAGGEMSAAIRAANTDTVVGIDGPTPAFLARLVRIVRRERASLADVRAVLRGLLTVTGQAVACRVAAMLGGPALAYLAARDDAEYDCDPADDPQRLAADERSHVRRAEAVLAALGGLDAVRLRDTAREAHMAARLTALRREGTVVAVVGVGHLDALAARLA